MMRNFRLLLCYDGTRYRGWQRLTTTQETVQGRLEAALSRILNAPVEVAGSGRTDAGAHAMGQVASFHADTQASCEAILRALRAQLPQDIGAISLSEAAPRFHARLNASRKTYVYRVWNSDAPDVFARRYRYRVTEPLDTAAMQRAAALFLGEHDFAAFTSDKRPKKSTVRRIDRFTVTRDGAELCFTVTGNGFLYNMVRILVGTLLEIGQGRRTAASVQALLEGGRREEAGYTVPAHGLCLMEVCYE